MYLVVWVNIYRYWWIQLLLFIQDEHKFETGIIAPLTYFNQVTKSLVLSLFRNQKT